MADKTYVVASDNCALGLPGDVLTADEVAHLNVDALLAAGHLKESKEPAAAKKES